MEVRIYKERKNPLEILSSGDLIIRQNEMVVKGYESTPTGEEGKSDTVEIEEYQYFETVVPSSDTKKEECISLVKDIVLKMISDYDGSDEVNSFSYKGLTGWLEPKTRANYLTSISSAELLGEKNIVFLIAGQVVTATLEEAKVLLAKIQRYADNCYIITSQHKANVSALTTVEELMNYDYKTGYPNKLEFK